MQFTTRAVRKADLPAVYDLLERSFPEAPRAMFVAQTERDSTFRMRHGRVAVDAAGGVIGWVRIFARMMTARGAPVPAGGIGQVATMPDARGYGIATALLLDAIEVMRRDRMEVSFLFTGIPALYERAGFKIVRQPYLEFDAREGAALTGGEEYVLSRLSSKLDRTAADLVAKRAAPMATGRIVRDLRPSARRWDEQRWLDEDAGGCLTATDRTMPFGLPLAYIRCAARQDGYRILEAETLPEHPDAIPALIREVSSRLLRRARPSSPSVEVHISSLAPYQSRLAALLRTLPSVTETADVAHPLMMRPLTDDPAIASALTDDPVYFWHTARI